jgi:A/G-specific adenine glycosylase
VKLTERQISEFRETVWEHYRTQGRDFPWRKNKTPYRVLVSEIMLQQTQADRVVSYFEAFTERWPDAPSLSRARLSSVLGAWQGLGYNRRAKMLHECAKLVTKAHGGELPTDESELLKLPGIGPYTAAAVAAFAGNQPSVVIETNIRSVYIHHFFGDREGIEDSEIIPLVEATVDRENPRDWYQALMDYGSWLKKQGVNPSRRSAHYTKQAPLKGSNREVRGAIIKALNQEKSLVPAELSEKTGLSPDRVKIALAGLVSEGLVRERGGLVRLP